MKILTITDSLALPRKKPEVVLYKQTWVALLAKEYKVHQLSIGGGVIDDFVKQLEYVKLFNPDFVILQIGIVDCAPRALSKFENFAINNFFISKYLAKRYLPKYKNYLRRKRQISYTTPKDFEDGIIKIKASFLCKVFSIGIIPPSVEYEKQLFGIKKKVEMYNLILKRNFVSEYIDLSDLDENMVMTDNIHLNKLGHQFVYQLINKKIDLEKK